MSLNFECNYTPVTKLKNATFKKDVVGLYTAYHNALKNAGKNLSAGEALYYQGIKNELENIDSVIKKLSNGEESFKLAKMGGGYLEQSAVNKLRFLISLRLLCCNY